MSRIDDRDAADLMHLMGHFYIKSGQTQRGLVLLLIAVRMAPEHTGILRALCHGFLAEGNAHRALNIVERLKDSSDTDPTLWLLKSRAHLINGERAPARQCYREYVKERRARDVQQEGTERKALAP